MGPARHALSKKGADGVATTAIVRSNSGAGNGQEEDLAALRADPALRECDPATLSPAELTSYGESASFFDRGQTSPNVKYFIGKDPTRPQIIKFVDITSSSAGLLSALRGADVLLYAGHSRHGDGLPMDLPSGVGRNDIPQPRKARVDVYRSCSSADYLSDDFASGYATYGFHSETGGFFPMVALHHAIVNGANDDEVAALSGGAAAANGERRVGRRLRPFESLGPEARRFSLGLEMRVKDDERAVKAELDAIEALAHTVDERTLQDTLERASSDGKFTASYVRQLLDAKTTPK